MKKVFYICTLLMSIAFADAPNFPDMPEKLTSLGAAVLNDTVYLYGGHAGDPHSYSSDEQSNRLWKLSLDGKSSWEKISEGTTRMQGLAMVAHGDCLYRIGGFSAKNKKGDKHNLWSTNEFFCYSITKKQWQQLPSLPQATSSHDAAVLDGKIYLIGGWNMEAKKKTWHTDAYVFDLKAKNSSWKKIATPNFTRRALAVVALDGKVYAIGGMKKTGGPSTNVDIYDVASNTWSKGPKLKGPSMAGFGCSASIQKGKIYVSSVTGSLQKFDATKNEWQMCPELQQGRFFHQMLPYKNNMFVMVGGGSMGEKIAKVDTITLETEK